MCRDCDDSTGRSARDITIKNLETGVDVVLSGIGTYEGKGKLNARGPAVGAAHVDDLAVVWRVCDPEEADSITAACRTESFATLARSVVVAPVLFRGELCTRALVRRRLIERGHRPAGPSACIVTALIPGFTLASPRRHMGKVTIGLIDYEHTRAPGFDNPGMIKGVPELEAAYEGSPGDHSLYRGLRALRHANHTPGPARALVDVLLGTELGESRDFLPPGHAQKMPTPHAVRHAIHIYSGGNEPSDRFSRDALLIADCADALNAANFTHLDAHTGNLIAVPVETLNLSCLE